MCQSLWMWPWKLVNILKRYFETPSCFPSSLCPLILAFVAGFHPQWSLLWWCSGDLVPSFALHLLVGVLRREEWALFPSYLLNHLVLSVWLLDVYFVLWDIIQCSFTGRTRSVVYCWVTRAGKCEQISAYPRWDIINRPKSKANQPNKQTSKNSLCRSGWP